MNPSTVRRRRLHASTAITVTSLLVAACAATIPELDTETAIGDALDTRDAVTFRTEGDPTDVARPAGNSLPLADAIRSAVASSPELQAALARVRIAEADAELASALPNPVLDLVLRFPSGGGDLDVEAGLAADLAGLFQRPGRSSAAVDRLRAEAAHALSTALDVVAEVQELYARARAAEELVPLFEARLAVLDRLGDVARARLAVGEGTHLDTSSLAADRSELAVDAAGARQERALARLALARRIGEPNGAAAWELDAWQRPILASAAPAANDGACLRTALATRPEIVAAEWEARARGEESSLAGCEPWRGASAGIDAERTDDWAVGPAVSLPLPVFDDGSARRRRALASEAEARHRVTELRRKAIEEVRAALATFEGTRAVLERVADELVPLAERRRVEVEAAFQLGQLDATALLVAERALQETLSRRVVLQRDLSVALVHLERAVGGPVALASTVAASPEVAP